MQNKDFYTIAHLVVAAIRVLEHQRNAAPSVDDVRHMLSLSLEQSHMVCNKLDEVGIIEMVKGPYDSRLFIKEHLKLEEIPRAEKGSTLQEEIERFQSTKKDFTQKIESFQAEKEERQKNLFAEIENRFKKKMEGN